MTRRTVLRNSPGAGREVTELLRAVATAELLQPSRHLWVVDRLLADTPVLDNRAGGFTPAEPSWGERLIGLADVLVRNLTLGGAVSVVVESNPEAGRFLARLRDGADALGVGARLRTLAVPAVPVRGVTGTGFHLSGGLVWTLTGATVAEEGVAFDVGAEVGDRAAALFAATYGGESS